MNSNEKMLDLLKLLRKILSSLGFKQPVSHQQRAQKRPHSAKHTQQQIQNVGVVDIDPKNLMMTLRRRYGEDGFEVHVRLSRSISSIVRCALTLMAADDA